MLHIFGDIIYQIFILGLKYLYLTFILEIHFLLSVEFYVGTSFAP